MKYQEDKTGSPSTISHWPFIFSSLAILGLLVWQGWMTLGLFSSERSWDALLNHEPLLSGRHPEHLYLGAVGAQSWTRAGHSCCYDPAFHAGYPKTPVFNGSRLAELALVMGGGDYQPSAYKVLLASMCMLVPLLLLLAARGVGLSVHGILLAMIFGLLVWWSVPCQSAFEIGEVDTLLASVAMLAHVGLLVRFDRQPGVLVWLGMTMTACLGWFAQPLVFPLLLPLFLLYYLSIGAKHSTLTWHSALWGSQLIGVAVNLGWLFDWVSFWWVRSTFSQATEALLPHRTIRTVWNAPLWGGPADRVLALLLFASAFIGVLIWNHRQQRPAARLLGLGVIGLLCAAIAGITWETCVEWETSRLLVAALWFATLPAAFAWLRTVSLLARLFGSPQRVAWLLVFVAVGGGFAGAATLEEWAFRLVQPRTMVVGLGPQERQLVHVISAHTGPQSRILWEDQNQTRNAPRWTALLPILTKRFFIGGLDERGTIEHSTVGFSKGELAGKPITIWDDDGLDKYVRRYNVGWIACWSPATIERLGKWHKAKIVSKLPGEKPGVLFQIDQKNPTYTLKGRARIIGADCQRITLADVEPENGIVVLSLHYQSGMRALPTRVQVEREPDPTDPIGFIRLRVARPVACVTLTWDDF